VRLRVRYRKPSEFVGDHDQQFVRGGLLVRVEPPQGLELYGAVELQVFAPGGESVVVEGQIVQLLPGVGVAVGFQPDALAALDEAVEAARTKPDAGLAAEHSVVREGGGNDAYVRVRAASKHEKIQMALHGSREERAIVLRDIDRSLHRFVLQNPHLGLDEVLAIAKMPTVTSDVLTEIAEKREWFQRPDIALALIRNPKTPVPAAVKLLEFCGVSEVRRLARDTGTRQAIRAAALKKLSGIRS
jgi:hypothetical protein